MLNVKIKALPHFWNGDFIQLPSYATIGSAGFDICSAEDFELRPSDPDKYKVIIHTGLCFEIPQGYEMQIRPRSGVSIKHEVIIPNSPGTIDSDYRGELIIALVSMGCYDFKIKRGDRIAQGLIKKVEQVQFELCDELSATERGDGGFGSTGR